jgi:hypothetical protein
MGRMTSLCCRVATTQRQLDDALRIRWAVFGAELQLLGGAIPPARREVNCFDTLETTVHLIVYADGEPVATSRLLLPNPEVALATGGHLGIELEQKLELAGVKGPGLAFAESTRFCILKPWRHSEVLVRLQAGLFKESRRCGVTHWIASANTETPAVPSAPFYTPLERMRARQGHLGGLRMPGALSLFARKMGARFVAEPLYDAGFRRFSLPLVAALNEVPASTLAWFDALDAGTSQAL